MSDRSLFAGEELAVGAADVPDEVIVEILRGLPPGQPGITGYVVPLDGLQVHSFVFRVETGEALGLFNFHESHSELIVHPAHRRQGIGSALTRAASAHLDLDKRLTDLRSNLTADGLGFTLRRLDKRAVVQSSESA